MYMYFFIKDDIEHGCTFK